MRWLVGDLQGCVRQFDRLLQEIRFDATRDEVWCLGDLVNRGPDSAAAVRLWNDAGGHGILGNHDVNTLLAAAGIRKRKNDTLDDLFAAPDRDALLASMRAMPVLVHLPAPSGGGPDVWIVHAGLLPGWTDLRRLAAEINDAEHGDAWLQSDAVSAATRLRCCTPEGELSRETGPPHKCREPFRPWDDYYRGDTLVVHGHWAQRGYYRTERSMGLDTGCVYGGPLTAWCQDEDRIVQVPGERRVKIATWNVNALGARLDFVLHWLDARQPDVVGIQELKLPDDKFPHDKFAAAGYHAMAHGQKGWNGVAILTREPAETVCKGLPGQDDFGSRLITARVGELTFTTVYVPNGKSVEHPDYPRKLAWLEGLTAHFTERHDPNGVEILCGDFNIVPEPLDSWHEDPARVHHTPAERQRLAALMDFGFVDLYREIHGDRQMFSWWDYRGGSFHRNLGLRIDLILGTPKVRERVRSIEIDRDYRKKKDGRIASDHAPVILELE